MPDVDRLSPDDLIRQRHIEAPALRDALLALPQPDQVLAAALRAQPTVLAATVDDQEHIRPSVPASVTPVREQGDFAEQALPHGREVTWPLPVLASAARAVGVVTASLTASGEVDELPIAVDAGGTVYRGSR